ncbi:hypothetical protein SDC9_192731 [bioreactor metagenome]|uniref:Uncharacterized protein n=1 Tax=bioreactor metagenome TaxID=1076179 RepID=A0A645IA18_9ZZZZ
MHEVGFGVGATRQGGNAVDADQVVEDEAHVAQGRSVTVHTSFQN